MEKILDRDNLNRAYKRVKANKGAPGVDGMTVEAALPWLKEHGKSGVMENGVVMATEEGSPQGGPLSPLLANIYLNEFDHEYEGRGVPVVRNAS